MRLSDWLHAENLTDAQMVEVLRDHEALNHTGKTGDTLIRKLAETYCAGHVGPCASTVLWMDQIATWCYRQFAERYIRDHGL